MKDTIALTAKSFLTWEWTKQFLYWLIISAGTVSECVFLVASIWMSINSSVHPLILSLMSERDAQNITQIATAGYVALPELILGLAFVTVISHIRVWRYNRRDTRALVWTILYGLPTLVFLVLSLVTLGCSVTSTSFIMPMPLVVIRALAGYMFAFTSLLYSQLGVPQEKERLQEKDEMIAGLRRNHETILDVLRKEKDSFIAALRQEKDGTIAELKRNLENITARASEQKAEMENLKASLEQSINAERALHNAIHKSNDEPLAAYSEECIAWLKSGIKTVNLDEINRFTGHSKRVISSAINRGSLQVSPRNKDLILVSSLVNWLKTVQPIASDKPEEKTHLHIVNG